MIGLRGEFSTSMKYIGEGGCCQIIGGDTSPGFAPMLIEFPKNIGKSRDKSYSTDQKTSSILLPTHKDRLCNRGVQRIRILKNRIIQLLLLIRFGIVIFCFFRIRIRIQFWMITNDFNKLLVAYWLYMQ